VFLVAKKEKKVDNFRIGLGTDIHRLEDNAKLYLGGIEIPSAKGAVAHSDGDALIHAIVDALLGAAGLGDIGSWFPDTDPKYKNIRSEFFLKQTQKILTEKGFEIINIDATVRLQKPKLAHLKKTIRENLAKILAIKEKQINIKAKTGEKIGPVGENKAVEVFAIALIAEKAEKRVSD